MKMSGLLIAAVFGIGVANASPSCEAVIDKVAKGFAAARKLSDGAKCRALSLVILDANDLGFSCLAPEDTKIFDDRYVPLAKSIAVEVEKDCSK